MKTKTGWKKWLGRILNLINPLRDPSLIVAAVLTFVEEVGNHDAPYWIAIILILNWVAVRGVVWLVVNFTFASTFIARRVWWAIKHPRLAWRLMDAIGHEEIVIGGLPSFEGVFIQDESGAMIMNPMLGASGIQIIGELPAGTEVPMLGLPNGQMAPNFGAFSGAGGQGGFGGFPGAPSGMYNGGQQPMDGMGFPQNGGPTFTSSRNTDGLPQSFPQRPSVEEERLRQQLAVYSRLLDDWVQFTEEKWRTVSDSQLGWKPLRGRWGNWDDIFQDAYAAKTSDPMAQAAQAAGEANARRYESSKEKGSAASAVACFLRDMSTLRRGLEMMQSAEEQSPEPIRAQPVMQPPAPTPFGNSGSLRNGNSGGPSPRNSLIRRPAQIFVDADPHKQ